MIRHVSEIAMEVNNDAFGFLIAKDTVARKERRHPKIPSMMVW
jgi:hypothetical protein